MIVLKILGIIILSVIAMLLLVLSVRVDLILKAGSEAKFTAYVRILGIPFGKPKKKKSAKKKKKKKEKSKPTEETGSSFINRIFDFLGLPYFGMSAESEKDKDGRDVLEIVNDTAASLKIIVERLAKMLACIRLRKLDLIFISGGEDAAKAAMDYGTACSVLYPLMSFMQAEMKTNPKKINMDISCDFEREKHFFKLDAVISLRVFHAFWAVMTIIFKNIAKDKERG